MVGKDQTRKSDDATVDNDGLSMKVYTPRVEEFEDAVKSARTKFQELPTWLRENIKSGPNDK